MAKISFSTKRLQIDKANSMVVIVISVAVFVAMFSLVASKALLSKRAYQAKVISAKEKAARQLKDNLKARDTLVNAYKQFVEAPANMLGGSSTGTGEKDGDNARLVLDALPSKYDYPALATSLEKILSDRNYKITSITGVDDEIGQQPNASSPEPQPIDMPFEISVEGTYESMSALTSLFEQSVRPFQIQKLSFSGTNSNIQLTLGAKTYYQPAKDLDIKTVEIK